MINSDNTATQQNVCVVTGQAHAGLVTNNGWQDVSCLCVLLCGVALCFSAFAGPVVGLRSPLMIISYYLIRIPFS